MKKVMSNFLILGFLTSSALEAGNKPSREEQPPKAERIPLTELVSTQRGIHTELCSLEEEFVNVYEQIGCFISSLEILLHFPYPAIALLAKKSQEITAYYEENAATFEAINSRSTHREAFQRFEDNFKVIGEEIEQLQEEINQRRAIAVNEALTQVECAQVPK